MAALLTVLICGERPSWAIAPAGGCEGLPWAWGDGAMVGDRNCCGPFGRRCWGPSGGRPGMPPGNGCPGAPGGAGGGPGMPLG
jgi:hypothetical protein